MGGNLFQFYISPNNVQTRSHVNCFRASCKIFDLLIIANTSWIIMPGPLDQTF